MSSFVSPKTKPKKLMRQKLPLLIFFLLCLTFLKSNGQAPPVFDWQQSLGGTSYDAATNVFLADDGGYILVGTTNSNDGNVSGNHGLSDVWVVKLDASGALQWQHCFGGNKVDGAVSAVQISGGKIFVVANTNSNNGIVTNNHGGNNNTSDVWLLALNSTGTLLWQKTFGGSSPDVAHALIKTSDNNLLIGASTESNDGDITGNHGGEDFWLIKVDTLGNLIWQKSLGGTGTDICNSLTEATDGYIGAGSSNSNNCDVTGNRGGNDFWIVKTDFSGNLIWEKSYGGSSNESALTAMTNVAGNFVIGGYTNSLDSDIIENHGSSEFWLLELDTAGNKVLQSTYGGSNSDIAYSIVQADTTGYLLAGVTTSNDYDLLNSQTHGGEDCWLMKADATGNLIWSRVYGGSLNDRAASVFQTADGGYIIAGYSESNDQQVSGNHGGKDFWVAKLSCLNPVAAFNFSDDSVCVGALMNFTNHSSNSAAYTWLADGIPFNFNTDANFQFIIAGTYQISLVGATCYASDTASHDFIGVNPHPYSVNQDAPYVCTGSSISLSTQYAESYLWLPDSLTTSSIQITSGGDYSVVTDWHQCIVTSSVTTIIEHPSPVYDLGNDTTFCLTTVYTIHSAPDYQSYLWQNGSTDSVFFTNVSGLYYVTVSTAYCSTTDSINLTTIACNLPVANFAASQTSICEGTCISFTDLSSNADTWQWSFQGPNTTSSTDQNPANICYSVPGTYEVELLVTNSMGGNALTLSNYITVNAVPSTPTVIVNGFWLSSSVAAASYQWYLNSTAINGATMQSYPATLDGFYYVIIDNGTGCTSMSDSVYIDVTLVNNNSQNANFTVSPNPSQNQFTVYGLQFTDRSFDLLDVTGKVVMHGNLNSSLAKTSITVSTLNLENGIYFLKINTDKESVERKVVISR